MNKNLYLKYLEEYYSKRKREGINWGLFNCFSFYFKCRRFKIFSEILKAYNIIPQHTKVLDVGSGFGDFILDLLKLGFSPKNITTVEYLKDRYEILQETLPHIRNIKGDFLQVEIERGFDLITILAVLTSITDNQIRYEILKKAFNLLNKNGILVIYDFFNEKEIFINQYYRALSLKKIINLFPNRNIKIYPKVYLNIRLSKLLCKLHLAEFIPILEKLKFLNPNYHFLVIKK